MVRVTGPMHSDSASGSLAKAIVFATWKGVAYVRQHVTPINNRTADQQLQRGFLGVIAKSAKAVLTAAKDTLPGMGSQFFLDTLVHIPGTKSWIAVMQANENGAVAADKIQYLTLAGVIALYDAEAALMGMVDYITVGDTPVTYTAGFQLYILAKFAVNSLAYSGFVTGGIDAATAPELALFKTYCQTSV